VPELKFDDKGLLVAIAQDRLSGEVRMVAWMNREALDRTLETGLATFYSRSRQALWVKGESSGNHLRVHAVTADCDGDALILSVTAEGPSCHTGARNCFFNPVDRSKGSGEDTTAAPLLPILTQLERTIDERAESTSAKSYTKSLLEGGAERISGKITEEAGELADAIRGEASERVAAEAADLLFHVLVGLRSRGVAWDQVIEVLRSRMGVSGHVEKARRAPPPVT